LKVCRDRAYRNAASVSCEYDQWTVDGILERHWGDHIHHGFYPSGKIDGADFKRSKVDLNDRFAMGRH